MHTQTVKHLLNLTNDLQCSHRVSYLLYCFPFLVLVVNHYGDPRELRFGILLVKVLEALGHDLCRFFCRVPQGACPQGGEGQGFGQGVLISLLQALGHQGF